jgi:hypothetical protein
VRRDGGAHTVHAGTPLGELLPREVDGEPTVAGLIDHRPTSLVTPVWSDAEIAPITTGHWEGARIHRHSVALLLLEAAARARPGLQLTIEHSHGYAHAVGVAGATEPLDLLVTALTEAMVELVDADLPLVEQWWSVEDARDHLRNAGWHDAAALLQTRRHAAVAMVSYGRVFAPRFGPLAPRTGMLGDFCLMPDHDGLLLVQGVIDPAPGRGDPTAPVGAQVQAVATAEAKAGAHGLRDHLRWLEALGTTSVAALNRACIGGGVSHLIRVAEGYQEKRIGQIADAIAARRGELGVVCIAGPSSSGKTTFIERLRVLSGGKPTGFKFCVGHPWEWFGICKAMMESGLVPDFIVVDGAEGGTGAAPLEFTDHVGAPLQEGLLLVHNALVGLNLRDRVKIGAAGKVVGAFDIVRMMALGADWCNAARGFMFALGCIQAQTCHTGACPTGVTTQDPVRQRALVVPDKAERVYRFHQLTLEALKELVQAAGLEHPNQITPSHIVRRTTNSDVKLLANLLPLVEPGALLEAIDGRADWPHNVFRLYWPLARSDSFQPAGMLQPLQPAYGAI